MGKNSLAVGKQGRFGKQSLYADVPFLTDAQVATARDAFAKASIPVIDPFTAGAGVEGGKSCC